MWVEGGIELHPNAFSTNQRLVTSTGELSNFFSFKLQEQLTLTTSALGARTGTLADRGGVLAGGGDITLPCLILNDSKNSSVIYIQMY